MAKVKINAEIVELREIDGDWLGSTTGFFAKGEWDKQAFAIACNKEFDLLGQEMYVAVSDVKVGYCRKVPTSDGWYFQVCKERGKGAFLATYVLF